MMESSQQTNGAGQTSSRSPMSIRETNNEVEHESRNQYQNGESTSTTRGCPTENTPGGTSTSNSINNNRHQSRRRDEDDDGSNSRSVMSNSSNHGRAGMDARWSGRGYRDVGSSRRNGLEDEDDGSSSKRVASDSSYYMDGQRSGRGYSDDSRRKGVEDEEDGSRRRSASNSSYYGSASMDVHRSGRGYSDDSTTNRDYNRRKNSDSGGVRELDRTGMDETQRKSSKRDREYSEESDRERDDGSSWRYHDRSYRWTCQECNLRNPDDIDRCPRCNSSKPPPSRSDKPLRKDSHRGSPHDSQRRSRTGSLDNREGNDRFSQRRSESPNRPVQKREPFEREWPPCFDDDGVSFVLDSLSGMFYEARSDFFYDPKSKLYYGNKKSAYFSYDRSKSPEFVEVQKVTQPDEGMDVPTINSELSSGTAPKGKGIVISINIKTKNSKKREKVVLKAHKEQAANMEKWSQRQAEVKALSDASLAPSLTEGDTSSKPDKVLKTDKGEPICIICRRRFPTLDKLKLHENLSELHKQNLQKLAEKKAAQQTLSALPLSAPAQPPTMSVPAQQPVSTEYEDRAQNRRKMYGQELAMPPPPRNNFSSEEASPPSTATSSSADNLGDNNIGNQMLQRLGWKAGSGLGRHSSGSDEGGSFDKKDSQIDVLRQDWDRIETLAAGTNPRPNH